MILQPRTAARSLACSILALLASAAALAQDPERISRAPSAPDDRQTLTLQVLLDRAGFSPGEIDGVRGENTQRAIDAFAKAKGFAQSLSDADLVVELGGADAQVFTSYVITDGDLAGPFTPRIPPDIAAQADLPALNYRDVLEALGERFHVDPDLLGRLNPGARFISGESIQVPRVTRPELQPAAPVRLVVSKAASTLLAYDGAAIIFAAPVTSGSEHDPLPIGEWVVRGVARNPPFHYNPDLFWDAKPGDAKTRVPPGPNNPVGVVWIDLSKEHYGLHGTPEPGMVGHTASHGCVRLTNWDASTVAGLVQPGTLVVFTP
jgi:lipoprotein-anchoring transpeptidase ErfK/SrfK